MGKCHDGFLIILDYAIPHVLGLILGLLLYLVFLSTKITPPEEKGFFFSFWAQFPVLFLFFRLSSFTAYAGRVNYPDY